MNDKKQKIFSIWLKVIVIIMGITGAVFFAGTGLWSARDAEVSRTAAFIKDTYPLWIVVILLCYAELIAFWRVATRIGEDNSFCVENTKSMHAMAVIAIGFSVCFAAMLILLSIMSKITFMRSLFLSALIVLSIIFSLICEILSRLIYHAWEFKHENDLTI